MNAGLLTPSLRAQLRDAYPDLAVTDDGRPEAVLGLGAFGHDAAVALVDARNGCVLHAVAEERLSNRKHDWHFPIGSIKECCDVARDRGYAVRSIAVNFRAEEFVQKTLYHFIDTCVASASIATKIKNFLYAALPKLEYVAIDPPNEPAIQLRRFLDGLPLADDTTRTLVRRITWYWNWSVKYRQIASTIDHYAEGFPVEYFNHHETHAASAYFNSGFDAATVLVIDGQGESDTVTVYSAQAGKLHRVSETRWPHSVGIFYLFATQHLGFTMGDEYKVMGMSAYGKPVYLDALRDMVTVNPDATVQYNETECLRLGELGPHGHVAFQFTEKLHELLAPRTSGEPFLQQHFDFAASVQALTESIGVDLAKHAIAKTGHRDIALAGGVALNGLMNEEIRQETDCEDIFIYPAAADDGCAVGAAQLAIANASELQPVRIRSCYFGHDVQNAEVEAMIQSREVVATRPESIHDTIAAALIEGAIVARCVGPAEFGPRALGHRSLLAHPGFANMKEILNARVKHREEFRPFAPACLKDRVADYFELEDESPFMLLIGRALAHTQQLAPSIVHEDLTARVQSVSEDENTDLFNVITAFNKLSNLPIVINTSFNVNGEAIVETAEDALESFAYMDVDYLALDGYWISKHDNPNLLPKLDSKTYLQRRIDRFTTRDLGPLAEMDISKFGPEFTASNEAIERFIGKRGLFGRRRRVA
ncbi:carbamoyltransferase [Rhodopirellula sp. MGV]|uniref:carbamoyltransferase family protein n=1 Tax=Rhodopirellula sp. MGV TaxID=2023130 RepID=UPI000B95E017|nr:carbamoyltransferase C-terminal domain-containing protein [Rhodopirellula sp. MGV]OYP38144.1 hypothetical protein CGZ80_02620 [Rhodopirellula sp. MGV]PNY38482.1 hypothetical protein C2E31_00680 [Rhodopirellula baltica]